jgi:hypothetical protein
MGSWLRRLWAVADPRRLLLGFAFRSTGTASAVIRDVDIGRREPHVGRHYVTTGPRGVIGTGFELLTDASAWSERLPEEPIRPVSRSVLPSKKIAVSFFGERSEMTHALLECEKPTYFSQPPIFGVVGTTTTLATPERKRCPVTLAPERVTRSVSNLLPSPRRAVNRVNPFIAWSSFPSLDVRG